MWDFFCQVLDLGGISGTILVISFVLVIIILRQERHIKDNLINLTKIQSQNIVNSLSEINQSLLMLTKSVNDLLILIATNQVMEQTNKTEYN